MVEDLQAELDHKEKKKEQKGVRENHSHILLTAVAFAPLSKTKRSKAYLKGLSGIG